MGILKKILLLVTISVLLASGTTAEAKDKNSLSNEDHAAFRKVAPELYGTGQNLGEISLTEDFRTSEATIVEQPQPDGRTPIQVTVRGAARYRPAKDGLTDFDTRNPDVGQFAQGLPKGFRIITVLRNSAAPREFTYDIKLPPGARLEAVMGSVQILTKTRVLGSFKAPWARDADGNPLNTDYTIEGSSIVQKVDITSETTYPVVMDPYWGYVDTYGLGVNTSVAWNKLNQCFNCYFPVSGAPSSFPSYGQLLPLTTTMFFYVYNMECKMGQVTSGTSYFGWKFYATKNHIDGLGSTITFQLKNLSGVPYLVVDAYIVNDFWAGNAAYEAAATANWNTFAYNLGH